MVDASVGGVHMKIDCIVVSILLGWRYISATR